MNRGICASSWRTAASPRTRGHVIKTRLLVTGFILLLLFLLLFGNSRAGKAVRTGISHPAFFLLRANTLFLNDLLHLFRAPSLIEENRLLKKHLTTLQKDLSLLQEKIEASHRSEELLSFQSSHPEISLFCRIIGRDPSHWNETVLLDKGKRDGVESDMAIVGAKGLVGRIVEVDGRWSKALLLTDSDSKVGAILERSRESGLLTGNSRGLLVLEYLSPGADVREGDKVLTAGFGNIFPKGLLIGEVVGFGRREGDLLMYALVKPAEELSQLEEVLCVKR